MKVIKSNMNEIFELPTIIKTNADGGYFRKLLERAKAKGIYRPLSNEVDDSCNVFFETITGFRFTLVKNNGRATISNRH